MWYTYFIYKHYYLKMKITPKWINYNLLFPDNMILNKIKSYNYNIGGTPFKNKKKIELSILCK